MKAIFKLAELCNKANIKNNTAQTCLNLRDVFLYEYCV